MPDAVFMWTVRDMVTFFSVAVALVVFVVREFRRKR